MRILPFIASTAITIGLVMALNTQIPLGASKTPRLGYFYRPSKDFGKTLSQPIVPLMQKSIPGVKKQSRRLYG